jgi:hypothetical protein
MTAKPQRGTDATESWIVSRKDAKDKTRKFEARNPKLETISSDKKAQCFKQGDSEFTFGFIANFEIVSDFDIRISRLGNSSVE